MVYALFSAIIREKMKYCSELIDYDTCGYFRNNHDNEMSSAPHSIRVRWLMKIHWSKEELSSSK